MSRPTIAILGAGPIGLEAAVAAAEAGLDFTLYEMSDQVAGNVRSWGHVELFTPWSMNLSPRVRRFLAVGGGGPPDGDECPTGQELVDQVFEPLAGLPAIADGLRLGTKVLEIGREGLLKSDEIGTGQRSRRRFRLLVRDGDEERVEYADVVLDCTGTYHHPNALGSGGIRAPGEAQAEERIIRRIPDFDATRLEADARQWRDQRILLVGGGHSAQTAARDLRRVVEEAPDTRVTWAVRSSDPTFGAVGGDPLPARAALVRSAQGLTSDDSPFDVRLGRSVERLTATDDGIRVTLVREDGGSEVVSADWIVSLTGSVGDARLYRQLQVHECYATSGPMKLAAALLGAGAGDCLTQESHGVETLRNPEPDFYILGSKSYGRNNTFLLRVGWEQVDEVFSLLASDARREKAS